MREIPGQVDLMDALGDLKAEQDYIARHTCPHCDLTYWASPGNPRWTLALQDEEHVEVEPGVCRRMAEARETLIDYATGRKVSEPHWSKNDLRIYILQCQDVYDHVWKAHRSRQESQA